MDKILQPAKLNLDVNLSADGGNGTRFTHWKTQMTHYIDSIKTTANTEELQYKVLINVIKNDYKKVTDYHEIMKDSVRDLKMAALRKPMEVAVEASNQLAYLSEVCSGIVATGEGQTVR